MLIARRAEFAEISRRSVRRALLEWLADPRADRAAAAATVRPRVRVIAFDQRQQIRTVGLLRSGAPARLGREP
jgi:hypothetical protein